MNFELNKIYNGNCLEILSSFPDESVDCIITSPPYFQMRRYEDIPHYIWGGNKKCEHKFEEGFHNVDNLRFRGKNSLIGNNNKKNIFSNRKVYSCFCVECGAWKGQLGLEPSYKMFIDNLVLITSEMKRVLKETGTMFINLGDSYAGSGNGAWSAPLEQRGKQSKVQYKNGIPGDFYMPDGKGKKGELPDKCLMLIPHRYAIRCVDELNLILRNDIIWAKPNGVPESCTDRFSKKHEFIFFFVKNKEYYFDLDSVKDMIADSTVKRSKSSYNSERSVKYGMKKSNQIRYSEKVLSGEIKGKNPGDVSDFWNIPTKSSKVEHYATFNTNLIDKPIIAGCPKNGIILDPFCGSGTTLLRAKQLGRYYIGIEGSTKYYNIAENRVAGKLNSYNNTEKQIIFNNK